MNQKIQKNPTNPINNFTDTSHVMSGLLAQLSTEQMSRPTPCDGWTVQDLSDHVIANQYFFAGAAGSTAHDDADTVTPANAVSRYRQATAATLDAYGSDGALERELVTPFGTFPGSLVLSVAFADQLTHCWDLARALGATAAVSDELVADAQATWDAFIQEDYRNGEMFGPATPTKADATALDRLAAFTGRRV